MLVVLSPTFASYGSMTWQDHPRRAVDDDVAPTSLNEGRGEVVVPALVVMFYLGLECCLVEGAMVVVRAKGWAGSPNADACRKPFWERARNGISRGVHAVLGKGHKTGFPVCSAVWLCRGEAVLHR